MKFVRTPSAFATKRIQASDLKFGDIFLVGNAIVAAFLCRAESGYMFINISDGKCGTLSGRTDFVVVIGSITSVAMEVNADYFKGRK